MMSSMKANFVNMAYYFIFNGPYARMTSNGDSSTMRRVGTKAGCEFVAAARAVAKCVAMGHLCFNTNQHGNQAEVAYSDKTIPLRFSLLYLQDGGRVASMLRLI